MLNRQAIIDNGIDCALERAADLAALYASIVKTSSSQEANAMYCAHALRMRQQSV